MRSVFKIFALCLVIALCTTGCRVRKTPQDTAFLNCMAEADETYPNRFKGGPAASLHAKAAGLCYKKQQECKRRIGSPICEAFRRRYLAR